MTTFRQLRKAALALPEVEEGTHFGTPSFKVRGKGFAGLSKNGDVVHLQVPDAVAEEAVDAHPSGERLVRTLTPIGVSVPIADINGQALNALVRKAWEHRAPKRLAKSLADAESASEHGSGDLPTAIGRPATQALAGVGVTTLDQVAARSQAELLDLHGIGPRAIGILAEALGERGMHWAGG